MIVFSIIKYRLAHKNNNLPNRSSLRQSILHATVAAFLNVFTKQYIKVYTRKRTNHTGALVDYCWLLFPLVLHVDKSPYQYQHLYVNLHWPPIHSSWEQARVFRASVRIGKVTFDSPLQGYHAFNTVHWTIIGANFVSVSLKNWLV